MKKGFTLVEVLIAISIFSLATVLMSKILGDVVRFQRQARILNELNQDIAFVMDELTEKIQENMIDYEEYYSQYVIQEGADDENLFGIYYGIYGSRFFSPGNIGGNNPADLGAVCSVAVGEGDDRRCEIYLNESFDYSEGINPFNHTEAFAATAFCEAWQGRGNCAGHDLPARVDKLFLISADGQKKTLFAPRLIAGTDRALGMMELNALDLDKNGLVDFFECADGYNCPANTDNINEVLSNYPQFAAEDLPTIALPEENDLNKVFNPETSQFVPITPLSANLVSIEFVIRPTDDPFKAFDEEIMQVNPSVEIIATFDLAEAAKNQYPGEFTPIEVRRFVNANGVLINSYPPVDENIRTEGDGQRSWISDVLPAELH